MSTRRRWRLFAVVMSLCALVFTQSAVAAYACPGIAKAVQVAQMAEAGMPCAETMSQAMDDEQPALCHAHCQSAQGTLDQYQPAQMVTAAHLGSPLTVSLTLARRPAETFRQKSVLRPSASPPLAITNCCFRI